MQFEYMVNEIFLLNTDRLDLTHIVLKVAQSVYLFTARSRLKCSIALALPVACAGSSCALSDATSTAQLGHQRQCHRQCHRAVPHTVSMLPGQDDWRQRVALVATRRWSMVGRNAEHGRVSHGGWMQHADLGKGRELHMTHAS